MCCGNTRFRGQIWGDFSAILEVYAGMVDSGYCERNPFARNVYTPMGAYLKNLSEIEKMVCACGFGPLRHALLNLLFRLRSTPRDSALSGIYTYKRVVCVCLSVCLSALYRPHDICPLCGAASESPRAGAVAGGPARGQACTARARARMPYNFSTKKSYADAFQKQNRTRAHAVVYVTAEIFKKREKENQHATSQVQFTVCLLLECLLFESY